LPPTRFDVRPALRGLALLLSACFAWGCASAPAPRSEPEAEAARAPLPERSLRHEVAISYASNLYHWLDNLAGSTPGKTRDAYLRSWARYHDILGPEERSLLRRWRAMRLRPGRFGNPALPRQGQTSCLPPDSGLSRRQLMNVAAMEASTLDDLRAGLSPYLNASEMQTLEDAIALFDPPFREIWADAGYLEDFSRALEARLDEAEPSELVARMERFYVGIFETEAPSRISLIALFAEDRGTHAEANGRHLLLEIRPSDRPRDQVQVVYHELAHDLFARMPEATRDEWARWFLSRGAPGALAWHYQHEAIPTALGQGVAEARLAPAIWSPRSAWYHRAPVDALAKAIYPRLERALFRGEVMSESIAGEVVAAAESELGPRAPLTAYLSTLVLVGRPELRGSLRPLAEALPAYRAWEVPDDASGADFIASYPCLPILRVTAQPPPDLDVDLDEAGAVALPSTRESGAITLTIVARDADTATRMAEQLSRWPRWPEGPVLLDD
jgi:hypothetical protein